ncbi:MAG: hypothetical protein WBW92_02900 [Rhodanobacteraceae bacterium]
MKSIPLLTFASLLLVATLPAHAAQQVQRNTQAAHAEQVQQKKILDMRNAPRHQDGNQTYALGDGYGGTNGPYANPYRTYPPSCMADPLPITPTGPLYTKQMDMASYNQTLRGYVREPVTVTIWRIPCSSSQYDNAITLLRIQRGSAHEGDSNQYVVFPGVRVAQGSVQFDDANGDDLPRLAPEPNTIVSWTPTDSAMVDSTTYVLEDYPITNRPFLDYTQGFALRMDNFVNDGGTHQYTISVPPYVSSSGGYPTANEPLPINGYMTNNYYDPAHSGEGMVVQVYELPQSGLYALQFNWFTFGPDGRPFWLSGDAQFEPGARSVTTNAIGYRDNGGFSGNFGSLATPHLWGTITFQWNNCNRMQFSYQSNSGLPSFVPQGSGTRTWNRLGNANGTTCE